MSWKALVIGDLHWTAHNPIGRKDNLQKALRAKLLECWKIARHHQVDAIIQTGDVFHSPGIVYSTLAHLVHVLKEAPAPIFTVAGNHDLWGANPESIDRTPLGFLFNLGVLENAWNVHGFFDNASMTEVHITGEGYSGLTDTEPSYYAAPKINDFDRLLTDSPIVHVTHGMLVDRPFPGRHTLISDIANLPNAPHVLVNGHYHLGTGIQRVGKTLVINPGALCRLTAAVEEMERPVQVALLEVDGDEYDAELITLESAKPGHEVLSRDHLVAQAAREHRREQFLELLASEATAQALDLAGMLGSIAEHERVPHEVRDEALRRIGRAQEALAQEVR